MSLTKDTVVSFRIPAEKKQFLTKIAKEYKRTPASLMQQWLDYVFENYEMENSITLAKRVEESRKSKTIPAQQVYEELGLL